MQLSEGSHFRVWIVQWQLAITQHGGSNDVCTSDHYDHWLRHVAREQLMPRVKRLWLHSVWSSYGHTFTTGDAEEHNGNVIGYQASCLTCGAEYVLRGTPGSSSGVYQANNGDEPMACTHNTSMSHGYSGERQPYEGDENHHCNCLLCDS